MTHQTVMKVCVVDNETNISKILMERHVLNIERANTTKNRNGSFRRQTTRKSHRIQQLMDSNQGLNKKLNSQNDSIQLHHRNTTVYFADGDHR